jgi:1-acylglycerone phosphate reductase
MPVIDSDITAVKNMFEVNIFSLVSTTQAFAPLLLASKGTIVNIGSMLGFAPFPYQGLYNASKAAVNILTDNLRIELEPFGVRVILVSNIIL